MARKRKAGIVNRAREGVRAAREKVSDAKESAENVVKDNPFKAIAAAAAIGALVALGVNAVVNRKKKRSFFDKFRDFRY